MSELYEGDFVCMRTLTITQLAELNREQEQVQVKARRTKTWTNRCFTPLTKCGDTWRCERGHRRKAKPMWRAIN